MPGTILLPSETLGLVEGYVLTRALGPRPVKGLARADRGVRADRRGAHPLAPARRGGARPHALRRRDSEIAQLSSARDRARAGAGQVVAVVGEPGVGKSRLYWEFTRSHLTEGWLVLESTSVSYGKADGVPAGRSTCCGPTSRSRSGTSRASFGRRSPGSSSRWTRTSGPPLMPLLVAARRARRRPVMGSARTLRATAPDLRRHQARRAAREPASSPSSSCSRTCTGSTTRRRPCSTASSRACPTRARPAARQLPARVPARLGRQELLHAAPHRSAGPGERGRAARRRSSAPGRSLEPLKRLLPRRGPTAIPSSSRSSVRTLVETRCARRRARGVPLARRSRRRTFPRPSRPCSPRASIGSRRRSSTCSSPPPSSARTCRPRAPGDGRRDRRRSSCGAGSRSCRPPSSSTRRACSRSSSTRSSTR